jgi:hypothetical protein
MIHRTLFQHCRTNRMHFLYPLYYELTASTCFEHYLLIIRRRYTNSNWYNVQPHFTFSRIRALLTIAAGCMGLISGTIYVLANSHELLGVVVINLNSLFI